MQIAARVQSFPPTTRCSPMTTNKPQRPRNIANDILDAVETATSKWTRQKKSEERHPGMVRYRYSRMTREPSTTQKDTAWEVMEEAVPPPVATMVAERRAEISARSSWSSLSRPSE